MMFTDIQGFFIPPDKTKAKICFGNPPNLPTFDEAKVVVYGVPFDDTATFGKGSERGPEALRHVSARQIETFVIDEGLDIYEKVPIYDFGDFKMPKQLSSSERKLLLSEAASEKNLIKLKPKLSEVLHQFDVLIDITKSISQMNKIPLLLGGEHTLAYWPLTALADKDPVILHFDAHRDAKETYFGMDLCHTTPIYNFLSKLEGQHNVKIIQIGIRQADKDEQQFAEGAGIITYYPEDIRNKFNNILNEISKLTKKRNIYITFDIDALDICYTPCTGTPEPFGLTPEQVVDIFKAIHPEAKLIGADFVEVSARGDDYREAAIAVQLMLRMLARKFVK